MSYKKYLEDYKTVQVPDAKGKLKDQAVYIGPTFVYRQGEETALRSGKLQLVLVILQWLAVLGCLGVRTGFMRVALSLIPLALAVLSLYFMTRSLWAVVRSEVPLTRQESDAAGETYPLAAVLNAIILVCALAGSLMAVVGGRIDFATGDWIYLALQVAGVVMAMICFLKRMDFATLEQVVENITED